MLSESQGRTTNRTVYRTEKSFMEKVIASAVDRLASLTGNGPFRFQLEHGNVCPGSLALMIRDQDKLTVDEEDRIEQPHIMLGDNAKGEIRETPYNPVVGTVNYRTGELKLNRELVAGKLVDACYDFDLENENG